jgi:hypothetical protein
LFRVFASIPHINICCKQIIEGFQIQIFWVELTKFWLMRSYHVFAFYASPPNLHLQYISLYSILPYRHSV